MSDEPTDLREPRAPTLFRGQHRPARDDARGLRRADDRDWVTDPNEMRALLAECASDGSLIDGKWGGGRPDIARLECVLSVSESGRFATALAATDTGGVCPFTFGIGMVVDGIGDSAVLHSVRRRQATNVSGVRVGDLTPHVREALRERGWDDDDRITKADAFDEWCEWHGLARWGPTLRETMAEIQRAATDSPLSE